MNYKKNFLSKVIFQVNYQPILQLRMGIDSELSDFVASTVNAKPLISENQMMTFEVKPGSSSSNLTKELQWNYDGNPIQVKINSQWLQVITSEYTNFNNFHPVICKILCEVEKKYLPAFNRIAFRYINNINFKDGSTFDFKEYIDDALTEFSLKFKSDNLKRSMGSVEMKDDETNITTKFNFGFFNRNYPNSIFQREFVLDYDSFTFYDQTKDKIEDVLQKLRLSVNNLFERSIKEGLRLEMNK
jgi:uncharacterized protein (TIGR04255 family)